MGKWYSLIIHFQSSVLFHIETRPSNFFQNFCVSIGSYFEQQARNRFSCLNNHFLWLETNDIAISLLQQGVFMGQCSSPSKVQFFVFLVIKCPIGVQSTYSPLFWLKFVLHKIHLAPPSCGLTPVKSKSEKKSTFYITNNTKKLKTDIFFLQHRKLKENSKWNR